MTTYYKGFLFLKEDCYNLSPNINWDWNNRNLLNSSIFIKENLDSKDYNIILNFLEEQTKKLYTFEIKN